MKYTSMKIKPLLIAALAVSVVGCATSANYDQGDLDQESQDKFQEVYSQPLPSKPMDEGMAVAFTLHRNLDVKLKELEAFIEGTRGPEVFLEHAPSIIYTDDRRDRDKLALSTSERLNDDDTVEELEDVDTKPSYSTEKESRTTDLTFQVDLLNLWQYFYDRNIHKANVGIRELNRIKAAQNVTVDTIENFKLAQIAQALESEFGALSDTVERIKNGSCSVIGTSSSVKDHLLAQCKAIVSVSRDLPNIKNRLNEAKINFNALITAHPSAKVALVPINMQSMPRVTKTLDELIALALNNSSELEIERLKYIIAKNEQSKAWSDIFPSMKFGVSHKTDENRFLVHDKWKEDFATFNLNFIQKMVSAPYRARTAKYKALAADDVRSKAAIVTLATKVALATDAYNTAIDKWETSNQLSLIARDEYYKADAKHQSGASTEFARANAQSEMLFRQLQSMLDYADMWGAAARLYGAVGIRIIPDDKQYTDYTIETLTTAFNSKFAMLGIKG